MSWRDLQNNVESEEFFTFNSYKLMPVSVAERSKAWVCSRSPAGIEASNPDRDMEVCVLEV